MTDSQTTSRRLVSSLYNEVDCRIEHGAESGGHLEYVRNQLLKILLLLPDEVVSDKDTSTVHKEII